MDEDLSIAIRRCKRSKNVKFDLSSKGINIIPQEIYQLTDLEVLDLSNNKITSIDPKISNLTKLSFLNLSNNQIISLPRDLTKLSNLEVLKVSGNPLGNQFESLLKPDNQSAPKLTSALKAAFGSGGGFDEGLGLSKGGFGISDKGGFASPDKGFDSLDKPFRGASGGSHRPTWFDDESNNDKSKFSSEFYLY